MARDSTRQCGAHDEINIEAMAQRRQEAKSPRDAFPVSPVYLGSSLPDRVFSDRQFLAQQRRRSGDLFEYHPAFYRRVCCDRLWGVGRA